ncbi:MAG: hypothetical protein KA116_00030 [Proteobacteria bacterium]|nr:hypothetical protein [Pseudomonadota bacterium]
MAKLYDTHLLSLAVYLEIADGFTLSKSLVESKLRYLPELAPDLEIQNFAIRISLRMLTLFRDNYSIKDVKSLKKHADSLNLNQNEFNQLLRDWRAETLRDSKLEELTQMISYLLKNESEMLIKRIQVLPLGKILKGYRLEWKNSHGLINRLLNPNLNAKGELGPIEARIIYWQLKRTQSVRLCAVMLPLLTGTLGNRSFLFSSLFAQLAPFPELVAKLQSTTSSVALSSMMTAQASSNTALNFDLISQIKSMFSTYNQKIIWGRKFRKLFSIEGLKISSRDFIKIIEMIQSPRRNGLKRHWADSSLAERMHKVLKSDTRWNGDTVPIAISLLELSIEKIDSDISNEELLALRDRMTSAVEVYLNKYNLKDEFKNDMISYLEKLMQLKREKKWHEFGSPALPLND